MDSIRDILNERKKRIVSRSNSCIPLLNSQDPFSYAEQLFKDYTRSIAHVDQISIIDPYITPLDLDNLSSLFGGSQKITLDIISKFDSSNAEDSVDETKIGKDDRKLLIQKRKEALLEQGVFRDILFTHSLEPMHDRYYIYWHENSLISAFSIGGSIAQRFGQYIGIIEVNDPYLLSSINQLYTKLKNKTKEYL
ncbi:hypothetical protein [Aeromonas enteropelogenes]|uniref:hypothetical protein n=1 Tax=Aeromonas enteropelogenes TaxID=29489 RepID=UPI0032625BA6